MNSFEQQCIEASRKNWCWNIHCTTCGHQEFTKYFQYLCKTYNRYKFTLEIEGVLDTFTNTNLENLNQKCKFPDWLGYLGLVLYDFNGDRGSLEKLHQNWATQLSDLVPANSHVFNELKEVSLGARSLTLKTLERCEYAILGNRFKQPHIKN